MEKHIGIVIKVPTAQQRFLVVIDHVHGKIMGVSKQQAVQRGCLIQYMLRQQGKLWVFDTLELMHSPCELGRCDILFLHHVLELCYYFLPIGTCARDVVKHFMLLYDYYPQPTSGQKKVFIFKLLLLLGVYPERMVMRANYFHRLATESIDTVVQAILDLGIEKELDQWLYSSVMDHPHAKYFKTLAIYQPDY